MATTVDSNDISRSPLSTSPSNSYDCHEQEREKIYSNVVDAVKQCQDTFGGKSQLATDTDTAVSILLLRFERIFQHGLKQKLTKAVIDGAFRQLTELSGFNLNHMKPELGEDVVFWSFVKNFLNKDELSRFMDLKNVTSDFARGRAWLRAALNEHNLDRTVLMILADPQLARQFYEPYAFLLDTEKAASLPQVISSLRNIYFALKIDSSELELGKKMATSSDVTTSGPHQLDPIESGRIPSRQEALLLRSDSTSSSERKTPKRRHKKSSRKLAKIEEMSRLKDGGSLFASALASGASSAGHNNVSGITSSSLSSNEVFDPSDMTALQHQLESGSSSAAPPDLIPIFEKLDINYPASLLRSGHSREHRVSSSHNSEDASSLGGGGLAGAGGDGDGGSVATGASAGSLELLEDSGDFLTASTEYGAGGSGSVDYSGVYSMSAGLRRKFGHHRSQSDNTAKLQAIKNELYPTSSGSNNNGSYNPANSNSGNSGLSVEDMRQALLDMMRRKDIFERENHSLRELLRQEKEKSEKLQMELDKTQAEMSKLSSSGGGNHTSDESEISRMKREIEVLKGQLKRYVSAVNTLRQQQQDHQSQVEKEGSSENSAKTESSEQERELGSGAGVDIDSSPLDGLDVVSTSGSLSIDLEDLEAENAYTDTVVALNDFETPTESSSGTSYDAKLVAMSGLHAELLELNEQLHTDNLNKERTIHHLRNEINVLRGPLPGSEFLTVEELAAMFVNVWIPSCFLRHSHHIYHVHIRVKHEEWRIFKRYQQFYDFHNSLRKEYPVVDTFDFPPKRTMGNKDAKFIEERKQALQRYLQKTTNHLVRQHSRIRTQLSKDTLINFLPFFSPVHNAFTVNR